MPRAEAHQEFGLRVTGLAVTYQGRSPVYAVHDASLHLNVGDSAAIVGPSGSGKTSLLLALAGVIPSEGSITWNDVEISDLPPHKRGVGVVFQDGQLFPHLTVAGNVSFGLEMQRVERGKRDARVHEVLELVGLNHLKHRPVTELSGGERQRVALARTLAPRPRVVLLDEPLSSLDEALRAHLAEELPRVLRADGSTWLMVTHDRREAEAMTGTVFTMSHGRLSTSPPSDARTRQ